MKDCGILEFLFWGNATAPLLLAGMAQKFTFVVGLGAESHIAVVSLLFDMSDIAFHTTCEMAIRR